MGGWSPRGYAGTADHPGGYTGQNLSVPGRVAGENPVLLRPLNRHGGGRCILVPAEPDMTSWHQQAKVELSRIRRRRRPHEREKQAPDNRIHLPLHTHIQLTMIILNIQ